MEHLTARIDTNGGAIPLARVPVMDYAAFVEGVSRSLDNPACHCLDYFESPLPGHLQLFCLVANDQSREVEVFSHISARGITDPMPSLTRLKTAMHPFERELHERCGLLFVDHPYLRPIRYPGGSSEVMEGFPFYSIPDEELHEVGVGPVHAGVIEPGHFRFICSGEKVLHLEIQLGYQHRGVESLLTSSVTPLRGQMLAESIAGDTAIGHGLAHAMLVESLAGYWPDRPRQIERVVALELERMAMHLADTAALFNDVAYQLGQVVNEALRTVVINSMQAWCGNRFGKGLIRAGGTRYPLNPETAGTLRTNLQGAVERYRRMAHKALGMAGILMRFDNVGIVSPNQARRIGAVGMAARSSGLARDLRASHPFQAYREMAFSPEVLEEGDLLARFQLRVREVDASYKIIRECLDWLEEGGYPPEGNQAPTPLSFQPGVLAIAATEGWRGEIVHSAVTDSSGRLIRYRVKDPSLHNWMALALAVRDQEISDFPVCNKSFNLSYCGHDL